MIRNRQTTKQYKASGKREKPLWKQWEETVGKLGRGNGFHAFHLPALPTKILNQMLPKGLPDWIFIGKIGGKNQGRLVVIECKTGTGKLRESQKPVLDALLAVPCVEGGVFYSEQKYEVVKLLGGAV